MSALGANEPPPCVSARLERWPIARPFRIARGVKTAAEVVVATVTQGACQGRGECVPYARYGESPRQVVRTIMGYRGPWTRQGLQAALPPGAARNAIDCALWDLECKRRGLTAWRLAGVPAPRRVATAFTLSLDSPRAMGARAAEERGCAVLKLKLGSPDVDEDIARLRAVRQSAPNAELLVDANEGWDMTALRRFAAAAQECGVRLIEQPLPEGADSALADARLPVPMAADESVRDGANLTAVATRYQVANIKLDKAGGLTRALELAREAQALGLGVMVGCMVSTSLAVAPALLLSGLASVVDLDGPALLAQDRTPALRYENGRVSWDSAVWG